MNTIYYYIILYYRYLGTRDIIAQHTSASLSHKWINLWLKSINDYPWLLYTLNKTTLKTLIKLPDWEQTPHTCRVKGTVWVLLLLSDHIRPIYPTHLQAAHIYNPYHGYNYSYLMLTIFIGTVIFLQKYCLYRALFE